jgi:hypothetical protein
MDDLLRDFLTETGENLGAAIAASSPGSALAHEPIRVMVVDDAVLVLIHDGRGFYAPNGVMRAKSEPALRVMADAG